MRMLFSIFALVMVSINASASTDAFMLQALLVKYGFSYDGAGGKEDMTIGSDGVLQCDVVQDAPACEVSTTTWGKPSSTAIDAADSAVVFRILRAHGAGDAMEVQANGLHCWYRDDRPVSRANSECSYDVTSTRQF